MAPYRLERLFRRLSSVFASQSCCRLITCNNSAFTWLRHAEVDLLPSFAQANDLEIA